MRITLLAALLVAAPLSAQSVRRDTPVYADTSAPAVDTLRAGSPITLVSYVGDGWFRIAYDAGYGYVREAELDGTSGSLRRPMPAAVPDSLLTAHLRGQMDARGATNVTAIATGAAVTQPLVTYAMAKLDEPPTIALTVATGLVVTGLTVLTVNSLAGQLRYPEAERVAAAERGPEYLRIWEQGYREEHFARQRTALLIGGIIGTALSVLIVHSIEE